MSNLVDIQDLMSEKSENINFKKVEKDPYEGTGLKGLLVLKKIAQIEAILGGIVLLFATPIFLSDLSKSIF